MFKIKKIKLTSLFILLTLMISVLPAEAVSPDIVISQVYGGGGNSGATYTNDFIELFNRGTAPVSLAGWSVQYASATGTGNFGANSAQLTELPSVSLAPGQYLLVQEAQGSGGTTALPTPDVTDATPINISSIGGKVALVNTTTPLGCNGGSTPCSSAALATIVDLVGWDGANFFEGTPAPTTTNTTAIFRINDGCTDTDNNSTDFTTSAPNPRNSSSPLHYCVTSGSCTRTSGYWKTHSEFGPAPYDDTWAQLPNGASTPFFLAGQTYYEVLWTNPIGGNAYYILAKQYIAAELNFLNGADPSAAQAAFDAATALFNTYTPAQVAAAKGQNGKALRDQFISLAEMLDDYNNGYTGPGYCSEETLTQPDVVINEIDYDQPGTDTAEFIEIKNNGDTEVNMNGLTLELINGTGGGATLYTTINLSGFTLAAGDYFVICADSTTVANCDLDVSPDTNLIQNGAPDAVGLLFNGVLIDAVSYEGDSGAPYTEGSGVGLEDSGDGSISRCPDGIDTDQNNVDFVFTGTSTPGVTNACVLPPG